MRDLPEGWVETTLGELVVIKYGKDHKHLADGDYPLYGSGGIMRHVEKPLYDKESILIPRKGTLSNLFYVDEPFWSVDTIFYTEIDKEKVKPLFLFYKLKSIDLAGLNVGSAVPSLTTKVLNPLELSIPPLPEQKAIAAMLSSFDEKIELLREQNKTLETLAQTIFKEWFVHFNFPDPQGKPYRNNGGAMVASELGLIPKGWRVGKLGEVAVIGSGKRPKNKSEKKTASHCIPLIGATKIMGYVENHLYNEDIIVIGRVGTHGKIQRFSNKVWASDNTLVIKSKSLDFVYFILTGVDYEVMNRGAVQPLITQTDLKNYPVIVSSNDVMMQFNQGIKPIFEKVKNNSSQIQSLSKTRDALLPRLMNGQVRVIT